VSVTEHRRAEAASIRIKYPERVPVSSRFMQSISCLFTNYLLVATFWNAS